MCMQSDVTHGLNKRFEQRETKELMWAWLTEYDMSKAYH